MFASFGVGQVLWSLLWLTLVFMWMVLFLRIVADVFRSDDLSGWAKAGWLLGCLIAPFLGVLAYLIVRGDKMTERDLAVIKAQDDAARAYIRSAAGGGIADDLERLAALRDKGVLSDEEFAQLKAKALG